MCIISQPMTSPEQNLYSWRDSDVLKNPLMTSGFSALCFPTHVHLSQVLGAIRSEEYIELKACALEHNRKISAKLGEDGIADIAARMANARCQIFDRAIRSHDRTSERLGDTGQ